MNKTLNLTLVAAVATTSVQEVMAGEATRPKKPNILFILADDLGWQDLKCYDIDEPSPFDTPNIDQLASEGVKFLDGYSPAPTSSPSRGAILTGRHPARLQRTHIGGGNPVLPLSKDATTMTP